MRPHIAGWRTPLALLLSLALTATLIGPAVGAPGAADAALTVGSVAAAQLWISYDDGGSWSPQSVQPSGEGSFHTNLPTPPLDHSGFGSIRVVASDVEGNQIDQEVIRAWRVPAP
ncbi:hypothetical protein JQS43_03495 [Natronosporangium hydrolyticum]|uniref:Uncharacterized protein n=1 Tax=Natronosporangium hydrolyticum TaxID=2811111 RepID=A0A895YHA0_9ACTN|nr:hypothetical protein [Natronosporangium hydrolyticum]QSB15435.1 hypothetical protein JQS43_03495 [Natronosporangium hydrolyticum]